MSLLRTRRVYLRLVGGALAAVLISATVAARPTSAAPVPAPACRSRRACGRTCAARRQPCARASAALARLRERLRVHYGAGPARLRPAPGPDDPAGVAPVAGVKTVAPDRVAVRQPRRPWRGCRRVRAELGQEPVLPGGARALRHHRDGPARDRPEHSGPVLRHHGAVRASGHSPTVCAQRSAAVPAAGGGGPGLRPPLRAAQRRPAPARVDRERRARPRSAASSGRRPAADLRRHLLRHLPGRHVRGDVPGERPRVGARRELRPAGLPRRRAHTVPSSVRSGRRVGDAAAVLPAVRRRRPRSLRLRHRRRPGAEVR